MDSPPARSTTLAMEVVAMRRSPVLPSVISATVEDGRVTILWDSALISVISVEEAQVLASDPVAAAEFLERCR